MVKFKNILILLQLGFVAMQMMIAHSSESNYTFMTDTAQAVYNLEVAGNSNFYVSIGSVLVHNCETFKFEMKTLQHGFKHAADFGIKGNWNKAIGEEFANALRNHVNSFIPIKGTYRRTQSVFHYFDPETGLNVMTDFEGNFLGGWRLGADQIKNLLIHGNVQ